MMRGHLGSGNGLSAVSTLLRPGPLSFHNSDRCLRNEMKKTEDCTQANEFDAITQHSALTLWCLFLLQEMHAD